MRGLFIVLVVLTTGCGPLFSSPQPSPQFASYQYTVAIPTAPLAPNEQVHLVWEPHLAPGSAGAVSALHFCVALFGPRETVEALKTAMSAAGPRTFCPPTGAAVSSDTMSTTSNSGARLATDLVIPPAAGFYDVHQIAITSAGGSTSVTIAGGIIEVRGR